MEQVNIEEAANGNLSKVNTFQKNSEEVHAITAAPTPTYHVLDVIPSVNLPLGVTSSRRHQETREIEEKKPSQEGKSSGNQLISTLRVI